MKTMSCMSLRYEPGRLLVLDQQHLPHAETWIECADPDHMARLILELKVRGAPLIGVAAALSLADFRKRCGSEEAFRSAARTLREARPTAVNLAHAVDRILAKPAEAERIAEEIFDEDVALCEAIAVHGVPRIQDGDGILTHCNTGGLATAGIGTALGIIRRAFEAGKRIHVYADETRPLLQGGRLTAWELGRLGIPYTLICDNMAATLMRAGKIQSVFVGADRIALNGDFANKIGTYGVAVLARHHGIPFYTAAPVTTVDFKCPTGAEIPIEERHADEVRGVRGSFGSVQWAPKECAVHNPAFDMTPVELLTGLVLDTGYYPQAELRRGCLRDLGRNR